MSRSEIKGTARAAKEALMRARKAYFDGLEDPDVMLTPNDTDELYHVFKDCQVLITDLKKVNNDAARVSDVRREITPAMA